MEGGEREGMEEKSVSANTVFSFYDDDDDDESRVRDRSEHVSSRLRVARRLRDPLILHR